ncbi:hypothetical protein GUITHDRAFT_115064 [Guillardia theta CCMP2712]|uniref:Uncharacterized protein n=1 Tax=Guillardia theta (strain CCMP2712) TaxID=905079 RepID=L1IS58_GUITC|nr:hypothetical protein GUITHDRAFT_115064 [Guillardia theta CCMP2712]EKX38734.1 hypothetical protein GUITHDRAFT_115064 [Guillardia theta CCMP2712]|eukprot:XP_005825714.1 hypothetical protein GUITHDRAFT_115064 [Guillardia theta CCMP2712]
MSSSSHDWQASLVPLVPPLPPQTAPLLRVYLVLAVGMLAGLAGAVVRGVAWLLQDDGIDSPDALGSCLRLPSAPRPDAERARSHGGFDRRRLQQPHFNQTFRVRRVGVV